MKTSRICLRQPVLIWLSDFDFVHSVERTQFRWIVCDWWCSTCSRGSEIRCMRSLHDQQTDRITTTVPPYFIGSNHTMFLSSSSPSSWLSVVVAVGCVMRVAWLVVTMLYLIEHDLYQWWIRDDSSSLSLSLADFWNAVLFRVPNVFAVVIFRPVHFRRVIFLSEIEGASQAPPIRPPSQNQWHKLWLISGNLNWSAFSPADKGRQSHPENAQSLLFDLPSRDTKFTWLFGAGSALCQKSTSINWKWNWKPKNYFDVRHWARQTSGYQLR